MLSRRLPQASAKTAAFRHPRICSQITEIQRSSAGQDVKFLREYTISTHAPAGGATPSRRIHRRRGGEIFYSMPLREGRQKFPAPAGGAMRFSTHAPAGGDLRDFPVFHVGIAISTHAPCGRGDHLPAQLRKVYAVLSTHAPAGGGDARFAHRRARRSHYFYQCPCGRGRLELDVPRPLSGDFTHAPLRGGDFFAVSGQSARCNFSRPRCGATLPRFGMRHSIC